MSNLTNQIRIFIFTLPLILLAGCTAPWTLPVNETETPEVSTISDELNKEDVVQGIPIFTGDITLYLQPENAKVVKYAQSGEYEVFTLDLLSTNPSKETLVLDQASCDDYGSSSCINVVRKNWKILFQNIPKNIENADHYYVMQDEIGSFYAFTGNGILFRYVIGEGVPCGSFLEIYYSYYDLPSGKMLYGVYYEKTQGESPILEDEFCEDKKTERTTSTWFLFFDQPYFTDRSLQNFYTYALPLQAEDMVQAFALYERLAPYHEEVEIVGVWPDQGQQPEANIDDLVLYRGTEFTSEHFFVPYDVWAGKVSETELVEGMKLNFSGWVLPLDAGAGNRWYEVVKAEVLMTWR